MADQSQESLPPQIPYRVLVVDDDERDYQLLRDILDNSVDMSIVGRATDGSEAVALANFHQPDVILMDVNLPTLDGIQATYAIKRTCPRTVVIGVTGHFTPTVYTAMRTAGAAAFVCKGEILGIHETILYTLEHSIHNPSLGHSP